MGHCTKNLFGHSVPPAKNIIGTKLLVSRTPVWGFVWGFRVPTVPKSAYSVGAMDYQIHIIGGGLAGAEAAWQLANSGIYVRLSEMRGVDTTPAHQTNWLAELVCSNSFRSDDAEHNAVGLLHQ